MFCGQAHICLTISIKISILLPNYHAMKSVLVPLDFSELSLLAVKAAADIIRSTKEGKLYLLYVGETHSTPNGDGTQRDSENIPETLALIKLMKMRFNEVLALPELKGIQAVPIFQLNGDFEDIVRNSEKNNVELIVLGTHGVSGFKEWFVGSFAEKIVGLSKCPVLTVKENLSLPFKTKDVLFVSQFFTENQLPFSEIKDFAAIYNSNIHFLKVVTPDHFETSEQSEASMNSFEEQVGMAATSKKIINANDVESGVKYYLDHYKADMIAIETHGRKGLWKMFNPSIAERLVNHLNIPILTNRIVHPEVEYGALFPSY